MKLRVLGCSGGIGTSLRTTSLLVDDDILIDAGSGVGDLSLDEMVAIRHIFVTHSHLDHVGFIPLLVDSIFDRIQEPPVVHARRETLAALEQHIFNWTVWPDFTRLPRPESPVLRYAAMAPGEVIELAGRKIEMLPVEHVVPGAGYRVEFGGRAFAFSGDTSTNDGLWQALNAHERLDVLIVECAFASADLDLSRRAGHYCPRLLFQDIVKLRHRPQVFITHLKPGDEDTIMAECLQLMPDHGVQRLAGGQVLTF